MNPALLALLGARAVASGPAGFSFVGSHAVAAMASSHTLTINIGAPASDRVVLFAITAQTEVGTWSAAINGTVATNDINVVNEIGTTTASIYRALVPSGTTATLTVGTTASSKRLGVGVWRASGGTVSLITTGTGSASNLSVAVGDFIIAARYGTAATGWTGVTEQYDATYLTDTDRYTGAHNTATTGTVSPRAVGGYQTAQVAAAYRLS